MINFDKFLASFITEMKKYTPITSYNIPACIKKALEDQGLAYKDGEIIKTQRRISAEAKENGYGESEDDKVKKEILEVAKTVVLRDGTLYGKKYNCREWITWLEKQDENKEEINEASYRTGIKRVLDNPESYGLKRQGENKSVIEMKSPEESLGISSKEYNEIVNDCIYSDTKPADNIKTKFKVGNWYQCTKDFFGKGVTFDKNTAYYCAEEGCLQDEYGCHIAIVKDLYDNFKLWSIEDAKDGDVLVSELSDSIILFKCIEDNNIQFYCDYDFSEIDVPGDRFAVNDSGQHYGSVEDSKDIYPATKEQRDILFQKMHEAGYTFDFEKKELKNIHVIDEGKAEMDYCFTKIMNDEKISSTWSKEDKERYISCLQRLGTGNPDQPETINSKWFKEHVYPQTNITDEELAQARKEAYNEALDKIEYHDDWPTFDDGWNAAIWYLKKRNGRLQSHWKPSNEQMRYLNWIANVKLGSKRLSELYEQLKQL